MHLLEAMLEWSEADGDPRFLRVAADMVALFGRVLFDAEAGVLGEFFAADFTLADGPAGNAVYPGHHFEWCWLLAWAERMGVGGAAGAGDQLYAFGVRHGLDAQGLAIDECDRRGRPVRRSRRAWPQTELIKAHLTQARQGRAGAAEAAAEVTLKFLSSYLATEVPGLWMDQFDEDGRGLTAAAPASTLYHVVVAFRELILFAEEA
jgi:mannose-6-phosphate isomerase